MGGTKIRGVGGSKDLLSVGAPDYAGVLSCSSAPLWLLALLNTDNQINKQPI